LPRGQCAVRHRRRSAQQDAGLQICPRLDREMSFAGFPPATLDFLAGIAANNTRDWFTANRPLYDATVEAAKDFVVEAGPRLEAFAPDIRYEPKIGASLTRVNNDLRFD